MRNPSTDNTALTDVWGGGGNLEPPTVAESWEMVSSDPNDTAAGAGARSILVSTLALDYSVQAPLEVELDGETAVAIPGTHYRPNHLAPTSGAVALTAGPGGDRTNIGDITIRVAGGGATRMVIKAGTGKSEDGPIVVPLGFTAVLKQVIINWGKDQSGDVTGTFTFPEADSARVSSGKLSLYQNNLLLPYETEIPLPEKNEIIYRAQSANLGASVVVIQELELVDNTFL
jgi:hypothetical protein